MISKRKSKENISEKKVGRNENVRVAQEKNSNIVTVKLTRIFCI